MDSLMKLAVDFYLVDICIVGMGIFSFGVVGERLKALYIEYSMNAGSLMSKITKLVEEDKIEEAITLAGANEKKPLAHVVKCVLERADRDEEAMMTALDIAASEVGPKLTKNLGYISMCANVVTLIGLLGTVVGLIMSFKAVSFADPSQKQTLLADGISLAMHATALGLLVAIPTMVFYSFLHARQQKLFNEMDEHTNKLMETLRTRDMKGFGLAAYPVKNGKGRERTA